MKCAQLEKDLTRLKNEIKVSGVSLSGEISNDMLNIFNQNENKATPFMKLFWEQQKKAFICNPKLVRYHAMIVRFCILLAAKSASTYDELRDSNIVVLPSKRTLRDYRNAIKPNVGFNPPVIKELKRLTSTYKGIEHFVCLAFDEIKVKSNLVFNKYNDELIGFVDLGDSEITYSTFTDSDRLTTHALVYYVRILCSSLKFFLPYLATHCSTSYQLMPIFWKAVSILESTSNLHVITVSDGASPNRKFYQMHQLFCDNADKNVVYRTINLYSTE